MDRIIREWLETQPKGVVIGGKSLTTILFVDDQVIIAENEDELQRSVHKMEKTAEKYEMMFDVILAKNQYSSIQRQKPMPL